MNAAATRPFAAAGAALMGAGVIAAVAPLPAPAVPHLDAPQIALQASVLDIFTFPAFQQSVANEIEFVAIQAAGLVDSGSGLAQSVFSLPTMVITATQQLFSNDPLAALNTVESWAVGSAVSIVEPLIVANVTVGQIQLGIQSALLAAQPLALVSIGEGLLNAFDAVATASIIAGQNFINALVSLNIGEIVTAVVDGVSGVATSFVAGGQALVDGVVGAQTLLADALKTRPNPISSAAVNPAAALSAEPVTDSAPIASADDVQTPVRTVREAKPQRAAITPRAAAAGDSVQKAGTADDDASAKSSSRRAKARSAN
jgi:hypothetical protein